MSMKQHILAALLEEFDAWQSLLSRLSEAQRAAPLQPSHWTVKDILAHLMAWQQRSIARVEAALEGREPVFPNWPVGEDHDGKGPPDAANTWIYQAYRDLPWPRVYADWQAGFRRFLALSERVSERDLLDGDRYPWMNGFPLALVLVASYDHHQEHLEKLEEWMGQ